MMPSDNIARATTEESQYGKEVLPFPLGGRTNGITMRNCENANKNPGRGKWRVEVCTVSKSQLHQADCDSKQKNRGGVTGQADDEIECVSCWRGTDEQDCDTKMQQQSVDGGSEGPVLHEEVGERQHSILG
nr:uncharacterized protein CTRU02_14985 [Colletotrichum truncatum]KAF6781579.1 hypothetical protein CTRU02_14985 [Colletotrichum truncatum]